MTGRTVVEAVQSFKDQTQRVIATISNGVVVLGGGYYVSDEPHTLSFGQEHTERLSGNSRLSLRVMLHYQVIRAIEPDNNWQVVVVGYDYSLKNYDDNELIAFHWHPRGRSWVHHPHIHLGAGAQVGFEPLSNAHIPSGWITLPDVIHMAITELKVTPRRDDWGAILDGAQEVHDRFGG